MKDGLAFKTTPYDIAKAISQGLADSVVIAKIVYSRMLEEDSVIACDEDDEKAAEEKDGADKSVLWDLTRPLVGDCTLALLKFDDTEAKTVSAFPLPLFSPQCALIPVYMPVCRFDVRT